MQPLTDSQLGMLLLCTENEAPRLGEIVELASSYGIDKSSLRSDYLVLLDERLVAPIFYVDRKTYLPAGCIVTPLGDSYLIHIANNVPERYPKQVIGAFWLGERQGCGDALSLFPAVADTPLKDTGLLADCYLHWASTSHRLEIPKYQLFDDAARGFARLKDERRFMRAVGGCFASLSEKGKHLDLATEAREFIGLFPECEAAILSSVFLTLEDPYWDLRGCRLLPFETQASLEKCISEIIATAIEVGGKYELSKPDANPLIRISNRLEDTLGESFRTSNDRLFKDAVQILGELIDLHFSLLCIDDSAKQFESRAGYEARVGISKHACYLLLRHAKLVHLPEPLRKTAFDNVLAIVRIVRRAVFTPVLRICRGNTDVSSRMAEWVMLLLEFPEKIVRVKLNDAFNELNSLVHTLPEKEGTLQRIDDRRRDLADVGRLSEDVRRAISHLEGMSNDIAALRYVLIPAVGQKIEMVLAMSLWNQAALQDVCMNVLNSQILLDEIDSSLNSQLVEVRRDIQTYIDSARHCQTISEEQRLAFCSELGKVVSMSSVGKMVASVPLIPGFLTYNKELHVNINWNKWLEKVASILRGNKEKPKSEGGEDQKSPKSKEMTAIARQ